MSSDFYLPRPEQHQLRQALTEIPALLDDLTITLTRQARIQRTGLGKPRRQKPGSRLPYHLGAAQASDDLHTSLTTWVRHTCHHRQIPYHGPNTSLHLAAWLHTHTTQLALTEGSETAYTDINDRITECRRHIDLPPEDHITIDHTRIHQANRQILTAGQIERIAHRLGPLGHGLTKRRVETLTHRHALQPCARDGTTRFYRLGDVLDAHHRTRR